MRTLRTFADSAISLIQDGVNELSRMISDFDTTKLMSDMMDFNDSIRGEFDKLKQKIRNLDDKFIVKVDYDRNDEMMSYSIEDNVLTVIVNSDPESRNQTSERRVVTTLPNNVNVTDMKTKYNTEDSTMVFIFKKTQVDNMTNGVDTTATTLSQEEVERSSGEDEMSLQDSRRFISARMKEMHDSGISYRQIAKEFGVSDKTVARWIKELN